MARDDNSGARPAGPVVLRIKLRYDDLDAMVQKFASNVGKSGLFLPTKSIQPIGTEVKFELRLANDTPVLVGLGRVKFVKHPDPNIPKAAFGMAIELMRVSREGREVIIRMLERRRAMGLPEVAIPIPEDLEAARRAEVDTQPRAETSGVVRDAMAQLAQHESTRGSAPLLTSPRPGSGPIAIVRDSASGRVPVPMLTPEKSRPRRPQVHELIDKATELSSRMLVAVPELDMHVDLDSVLTRARALAGGDLDVELSALREAAAAPNEISVEAASAELARQLGGQPISKRERSARWAPPPAIELRSAVPAGPEFAAKTRAETEASPSATIAAVVEAAVAEPKLDAADSGRASSETTPSVVPQESYVIRKSAEIEAQVAAYDEAANDYTGERTRVSTGDDYDEAFLPNASTTTSIDPDTLKPKPFGPANEIKTDPAEPRMMIDDDADISSFERALDAARIHTGVSMAAPARPGDRELDDPPVELLASGEFELTDDGANVAPAESTQINAPVDARAFGAQFPMMSDQLAAQLDQQLAEAEQEAAREIANGMGYEQEYGEDEQEISDLDVLAEADEDDEDLLGSHGEALASAAVAPANEYPPDPYAPEHAYPGGQAAYGEPTPYDDAPNAALPSFDAPHAYDAPPYTRASSPVTPFSHVPYIESPAFTPAAVEPSYVPEPVDDFAARLDLGDDDEPPPSDDIDRDDARAFDRETGSSRDLAARIPEPPLVPPADDYHEPPVGYGYQRARRASSEPSDYTVAENMPQAAPHFAPNDAGEDFDEPHSYAPEPAHESAPIASLARGPDPRLLKHGRATTASTEDLEDALAALDVGGIDLEQRRRARRPTPSSSSSPRPLPGLPIERPVTGPVPITPSRTTGASPVAPPTNPPRVAHTVPRSAVRTTGQHSVQPTGPQPLASPPDPRAKAPTGQQRTGAKPPPIPAAARRPMTQQVQIVKPPTQPPPVVQPPIQRATTDDEGVLIDFDEDE